MKIPLLRGARKACEVAGVCLCEAAHPVSAQLFNQPSLPQAKKRVKSLPTLYAPKAERGSTSAA
jgi:hypothetical protein